MTAGTPSLAKSALEVVEPFPGYALPRLWTWLQASRRMSADEFSAATLDQYVDDWDRRERAGMRSWGVWRNGELGGAVTSMRFNPVLADFHCLFHRSFWGHETTAAALRFVFAQLFADEVRKIATFCYADNHALLGLVRKLGFEREGTVREYALRDGQMVDMAIIGLTRHRFVALHPPDEEKQVEEQPEIEAPVRHAVALVASVSDTAAEKEYTNAIELHQ